MKAKLTPMTQTKQLAMLKDLGEAAATRCIERSLSNGWRGLFPDSRNTFLPRQALTKEDHKTF